MPHMFFRMIILLFLPETRSDLFWIFITRTLEIWDIKPTEVLSSPKTVASYCFPLSCLSTLTLQQFLKITSQISHHLMHPAALLQVGRSPLHLWNHPSPGLAVCSAVSILWKSLIFSVFIFFIFIFIFKFRGDEF